MAKIMSKKSFVGKNISMSAQSPLHLTDAQLHALKNMASNERISLTVGAGAWAGGQSNIMRVDMGPSVRAKLQAGKMSLRLDASWRFRIVGNARPGDSPAVTLSTSF